VYVSFAYSGWNGSVYISSEISNPQRNIPLSLLAGTLIVMLLYVLLNSVFLYTAPINELAGVIEVGAVSAKYIFGVAGGKIMSTIIALLLISTISAMIWIGPRVTHAIGEDMKLLRIFSQRSTAGIPVYALWFQTLITLVLLFSSTFDKVMVYAGFTLNLSTFLTVAGVFVLRWKQPNLKRPYKTLGYPITPLIFLGLSLWTLIYLMIDKPLESFLGFATVLSGVVIWWIDRIRNKMTNSN